MNIHDVAGSASLEKLAKEKTWKLGEKSYAMVIRADVFFKEGKYIFWWNWEKSQY